MKTGWFVVGLILATAVPARADEGEPKIVVGGSVALWFPTSDADDFADVSLGLRPVVTYWIRPFIGVTASFDYVFVNEDGGNASIDYYAISAGGRLQLPRGRIRPYGELLLGWHFLSSEFVDDSNIGFRIGGGATYALSRGLVVNGGVAYSTTSIDAGFVDVTVAAFVFDVGIAARF